MQNFRIRDIDVYTIHQYLNNAMRRFIKSPVTALAFITAVLITLTGCSEDGTGPNENIVARPKAGSMYVYNMTRYDTNGTVTSTKIDTIKIIGTDLTLANVAGLIALWRSASPNDTVYAMYKENGDFAYLYPLDTNNDQIVDTFSIDVYPFGSHDHIQQNIDTLFDSGNAYTIMIDSLYYNGSQSQTVAAGTFQVSTILDLTDLRSYSATGEFWSRVREVGTYSFAPSIGFMTKGTFEHEFLDSTGTLLKRQVFTHIELKSYTLL